jgi:hypothetical protein
MYQKKEFIAYKSASLYQKSKIHVKQAIAYCCFREILE